MKAIHVLASSTCALWACVPLGAQPAAQAPAPQQQQVYVDPEQAAWAQKQAAFDAMFADELTAYRAIEARLKDTSTSDAKLVADADALRARFVKRCVDESHFSTVACWNATFARDITEALAKHRLAIGDKVGSYLESYYLYSYPDLRSDEAKRTAARQGVDDEPANIRAPEELRPLEDQMEFVAEEVKAVVRSKATATIRFAPRDSSSTGYDCGERRVVVVADPTTASGNRLAVKQNCRVSSHEEQHQVFPSVTVPIEEVEGLKVGQRASVVFAKRGPKRGHLVDVWPDGYTKKYIRLRTTRVKPADEGYP
jgi:hypothetical protein